MRRLRATVNRGVMPVCASKRRRGADAKGQSRLDARRKEGRGPVYRVRPRRQEAQYRPRSALRLIDHRQFLIALIESAKRGYISAVAYKTV